MHAHAHARANTHTHTPDGILTAWDVLEILYEPGLHEKDIPLLFQTRQQKPKPQKLDQTEITLHSKIFQWAVLIKCRRGTGL